MKRMKTATILPMATAFIAISNEANTLAFEQEIFVSNDAHQNTLNSTNYSEGVKSFIADSGNVFEFVLVRGGNGVLFPQHRSHSSHASHSSHSSSSTSGTGSAPSITRPTPAIPPRRYLKVLWKDEFLGVRRDPAIWQAKSSDSLITVKQGGGRLVIIPPQETKGIHSNGYRSVSSFNLRKTFPAVGVETVTNEAAHTTFAILVDDDHWYRFRYQLGKLYFEFKAAGPISAKTVVYDSSKHRYWRFRYDALVNQLLWETSADNQLWTIEQEVPPAVDIDALYVAIDAGTDRETKTPGIAVFDSFEVYTPN